LGDAIYRRMFMLKRLTVLIRCLPAAALIATGLILGGCATSAPTPIDTIKTDLLDLPGQMWQDSKLMVAQPENIAILLIAGGASGYVRC
jgi:hypothetical protein